MDLGHFGTHVAPCWSDFEVFFLVENCLDPAAFSAFLRCADLFTGEKGRALLFGVVAFHLVGCLGCPSGGLGLQEVAQGRWVLLVWLQVTGRRVTSLLAGPLRSGSAVRIRWDISQSTLLIRSCCVVDHGRLGALLVEVDEIIIVALRRVVDLLHHYCMFDASFRAALVIVFQTVQLRLWSVLLIDEVLWLSMVVLGLLELVALLSYVEAVIAHILSI